MIMTRTQAILKICEHFREITGGQSPWDPAYTFHNHVYQVDDRFLWVDEISNFPSVQCVSRGETITHQGGGVRRVTLAIEVRGFTWDRDVAGRGETLADDIEHAINHFQDPDIDDLRILSIQTDEGLNEPLGVVIIQLVATYQR